MDRRVGTYLLRQQPDGPTTTTTTKQSLLIAETREGFWLPQVLRNAQQEFPEWDLYVCAPLHVLAWLAPDFPGVRPVVMEVPPGQRASAETFSALMFSPEVWHLFETEFVMIFQCDSVFTPGAAAKLPGGLDKDFYGAACGDISSDATHVINGGLSLRRVAAFARARSLLTPEDARLPEDVAYCRVMRRHAAEFNLPGVDECMRFAIESYGNPRTAVGIHGTDKGYAPPALLAAALGLRPAGMTVCDCISYDGEPVLDLRLAILGACVDAVVIVEARVTHSGLPKALRFDPAKYAAWGDKIRYVVIDEFPPTPPDYGREMPWVTPASRDAWWREQCQRDEALKHVPEDASLVIVGDVDEIPDPAALADLRPPDVATPLHLDMAFLVHQPWWQKREQWTRPYVCAPAYLRDGNSMTGVRCGTPARVRPRAGWHCSSFFDVEAQIRKIQHFAHREHAGEIDPQTIQARFDLGRDPYGRGEQYDCVHTAENAWLRFV